MFMQVIIYKKENTRHKYITQALGYADTYIGHRIVKIEEVLLSAALRNKVLHQHQYNKKRNCKG